MRVRWILWAHAFLVLATALIVHGQRLGALVSVRVGYGEESALFGFAAIGAYGMFVFPLLVVLTLVRSPRPRSPVTAVVAEILLLCAHVFVLLPAVQ